MAGNLTMDPVAPQLWDAAVVGAGPAGSLAARELARMGHTVLLIDKASFPRDKVCGGCINQRAQQTLREQGLDNLLSDCGATRIDALHVAARHRYARIPLPDYRGLSRFALDAALVNAAKSAGATFLSNTRVDDAHDVGDRRVLTAKHLERNSEIEARIVIAADGLGSSLTRKTANIDPKIASNSRIGAGVIAPEAPSYFEPNAIHMAGGRGGYVGLARMEQNRVDIAAAFDSEFVRESGGLAHAAAAVFEEAGFPTWPELFDLPWRGTPALTRHVQRVAAHRMFTVGDAAGYIEPFTGEGLAWAMNTGVAVANVAAQAVKQYDSALEAAWMTRHKQLVTRRQLVCRAMAALLRRPKLVHTTVAILSRTPSLAIPLVRNVNAPAASGRRS